MNGIILFFAGISVGVSGILSAIILAPKRGDKFGYVVLGLILVGFVICYLVARV